jgi:hypothetical protein
MPEWNCLKHRNIPCVNMVAGRRECRAPRSWAKTASGGKFGKMHLRNSPVYRQQHGSRDWSANRDGPMTISDVLICAAHKKGHVRVMGLAHGVIVAMTPVIISRRSQGPLDCAGHSIRKVEGIWPSLPSNFDCTDCPQLYASAGHGTSTVQFFQTNDEVCSKPRGKTAHEIEGHGLKPYSRDETVRDFRGLGGNGCVAVFQPAGGMPRVCNETRQYDTNCATILLGKFLDHK